MGPFRGLSSQFGHSRDERVTRPSLPFTPTGVVTLHQSGTFFEEFLRPEIPPSFDPKPHFRAQKKPAGRSWTDGPEEYGTTLLDLAFCNSIYGAINKFSNA